MKIRKEDNVRPQPAEVREGILCAERRHLRMLEISPSPFLLRSAAERDAVASSFGAMLRSAPSSIRFKIVSVPPLNGEQERIRREEADRETDPGCLRLQKELDGLQ